MAITTGVFPIATGRLTTVDYEDNADGSYARSLDNVKYTEEGEFLILLDNDPHPEGKCFATAQEYLQYLLQLHPLLKELEILVRPSSSAGIRVNGSLRSLYSGWHAYITADAGVQVQSVKQWLESLCWKAGDGYIMLTKVGAMLPRCTFDLAVFSPERLIFIAAPKLDAGVTQDHIGSVYQKGRSITKADKLDYDNQLPKLIDAAKKEQTVLDKQKVIQEAYVQTTSKHLATLTGKPEAECIKDVQASLNNKSGFHYLPAYFEVTKADGTQISLQQLVDAGKNEAIADPIEGLSYGRTTAKYYHNDGKPVINSLAHGGIKYRIEGVNYSPVVKEFWQDYAMNHSGMYVCLTDVTAPAMNREAFNNRFANEPCLVDADGNVSLAHRYAFGLLPTIAGTVYNPLKSSRLVNVEGRLLANSYKKYQHPNIDEPCDTAEQLIKTHLHHLFEDELEQGFMLDWMAWQVQKPGKLLRFCPLIVGQYGDGKSTIASMLTAAMGKGNSILVENKETKSDFNPWANKGAVCAIEELKSNGNDAEECYNRIKTFITERRITVNDKHVSATLVDNVTNYISFSNYKDALPLAYGDRRFWVLFTRYVDLKQFDKLGHVKYFDDLFDFINSDIGGAKIYDYLNSYQISAEFMELRSSPDSIAKTKMVEAAYDDATEAVLERITSYGSSIEDTYLGDTVINVTEMARRNQNDCNSGHLWDFPTLPTGKAFKKAMDALGYLYVDRQRLGKKTMQTIYKVKK